MTELGSRERGKGEPLVLSKYDAGAALEGLRAHGAVLLRARSTSLEDFVALTDEIMESTPHHSVATKERDVVAGGSNVATVNKGIDAIPLHRESSFLPTQPDVLCLYCQVQPAAGGQTTLCDGVELLRTLPKHVRAFVNDEVLVWRFRLPPERWRVAFDTDAEEIASHRIEQLMSRFTPWATYEYSFTDRWLDGTYRAPLVLPTFWGKIPAFANSVLGYYQREIGPYVAKHLHQVTISSGRPFPEEILRIIGQCAEELVIETRWRTGDVLLVDNSHVMHGRRAVVSQQRRIVIRLGRYRPEIVYGRG